MIRAECMEVTIGSWAASNPDIPMASLRGLLLLLVIGSTTACIGPLAALEPLRPLAPEPVCTNRNVPVANADGSTTSQAYSECSVSLRR